MITALIILILTYIGIAFNRLPRVNIDRPSAAFIGAVLMVLFGVLSFPEAIAAIDFNTIALLLGMMALISVLQKAGFFTLLAVKVMPLEKNPRRLLLIVTLATAAFSAFLVNDAVVLLFTPVVIQTCRMMKVNPVPYLIAEAMASNAGSTATIVGNPQNMLIGVRSGISFTHFFLYLAPVALLSTVALFAVVYLIYRKEFDREFEHPDRPPATVSYNIPALQWSVPIMGLTIAFFFLSSFIHVAIPLIALTSAAAVLLAGRIKPSEVIRGVDWVLLLFFAGLFIVIGGAHQAGVLDLFLKQIRITPDVNGMVSVTVFSAVVSQLVSNVPLTMLVIPAIQNIPGDVLWIALAAGSTLGGNATVIGAVANIIVVEGAAREGINIKFMEFLKVGVPVTVVTLALAIAVMAAEYYLGLLV